MSADDMRAIGGVGEVPHWFVICAGVVFTLGLAACAVQDTHPSKIDHAKKTTAAVKPGKPEVHVAKAHAFEQDKARVKNRLASNERDALKPNEVGYYLDVLQGRLKQASAGTVVGLGFDRIVLDLSTVANFTPTQAGLDRGSCARLSTIADILREYRKTLISVRVRATADNAGALQLAQKRARSLAGCLIRDGVAAKRIVIVAIRAGDSMLDSAASIHVEIQIEPIVHRRG